MNSKEIFTIFALIGCKVLNTIEEENIFKDLKDKFISEKYLSRKDFFEYNFWFEKDLEYQKLNCLNLGSNYQYLEWIKNQRFYTVEKKKEIRDEYQSQTL